jgi:hypothetical protein
MKSDHLKLVKSTVMRPVASKGRKSNTAYRVREHLTEQEVTELLMALKANRHGHRDWLVGLLIYRHGLRVSEACDLRWDDIDLPKRTITHERGQPFSRMGIARMIERAGEAAKLAFPVHVHMLRHSTGHALANRGWIRDGCNTSWAMLRLRTRCVTPPCHRSRSRTVGARSRTQPSAFQTETDVCNCPSRPTAPSRNLLSPKSGLHMRGGSATRGSVT